MKKLFLISILAVIIILCAFCSEQQKRQQDSVSNPVETIDRKDDSIYIDLLAIEIGDSNWRKDIYLDADS